MSVVNQMLNDLEQSKQTNKLLLDQGTVDSNTTRLKRSPFALLLMVIILVAVTAFVYAQNWKSQANQSGEQSFDKNTQAVGISNSESTVGLSAAIQSNDSKITSNQVDKAPTLSTIDKVESAENTTERATIKSDALVTKGNSNASRLSQSQNLGRDNNDLRKEQHKDELAIKTIENESNHGAGSNREVEPQKDANKDSQEKIIAATRVPSNEKVQPLSVNNKSVKSVSLQQYLENQLVEIDSLIGQGFLQLAKEKLLTLIPNNQKEVRLLERYAFVLSELNEQDELVEFLESNISQQVNVYHFKLMLARQHAKNKRWQTVIRITENIDSSHHDLLLMRALAFQQSNKHDMAIEEYRKLLVQDSNRGDWWIGLSISLENMNQNEAAKRALERALTDSRLSDVQKNYIRNKIHNLAG